MNNYYKLWCIVAFLSLHVYTALSKTENAFPASSLCFIENKGQIIDQKGHVRADINYEVKARGVDIFIGHNQLHYQFRKNINYSKAKSKLTRPISSYRIDMELVGANNNAQAISQDEQAYYENYFLSYTGSSGISAHSYKKVTYKNIYPNIDWVIYIKNNKLEYDFVVHSGGDAKNIKLKYNGATALKLKSNGSLEVSSPLGSVTEQKPLGYNVKDHSGIPCSFKKEGNILSFDVAGVKDNIVIDPILDWATYYGGSLEDENTSLASDTSGIYLAGYTTSTTLATAGAFQTTFDSACDGVIVKFNTAGQRLWATYFGGKLFDYIQSVSCDGKGNVFAGGYTTSADLPVTPGCHQPLYNGFSDAFVAKFNKDGLIKWATYYGGTSSEDSHALVCDSSGNVYLSGSTASTNNISTLGSYQMTRNIFSHDIFIVKFDSLGVRQWGTYFGGDDNENCYAMTYDRSGDNIFFTGYTASTNVMASFGAFQPTKGSYTDAFIEKFSTAGQRIWGSYYGGNAEDDGYAVICDHQGSVYFGGYTTSSNNIGTPASHQPALDMDGTYNRDAFLVKFNVDGIRQWGTYFGGSSIETIQALYCDSSNYINIGGYTGSLNNIVTPNGYQTIVDVGSHAFWAKFDTAGSQVYGTYYTGNADDACHGITGDASGNIYLGGQTRSDSNFAVNGFQDTLVGIGFDMFLVKFHADTSVSFLYPFVDTTFCQGASFTVSYFTSGIFNPANVFTVQLSDASGSFITPTDIGSVLSAISGTITCTIPLNATPGNGYRIRILASNPAYTSSDDGKNITINIAPATPAITANTPLCAGNTLNLATPSLPNASYSWNGPNGFMSTLQNPSIPGVTPADSGNYILIVTVNGCASQPDTASAIIFHKTPLPVAGANNPVCAGSTLSLSATDTAVNALYNWYGPNGYSATIQDPAILNVMNSNSGIYSVTATANGCVSDTNTINIIVNPTVLPIVSISSNPTFLDQNNESVTFTATSVNGGANPTYQWRLNGNDIVGGTTNPFTTNVSSQDLVTVVLHSDAVCAVPDSALASELVTLGINTMVEANTVSIYPNPTNGDFVLFITMPDCADEVLISISNSDGKTVYQAKANMINGTLKETIHLPANIAEGVYSVHYSACEIVKTVNFLMKK